MTLHLASWVAAQDREYAREMHEEAIRRRAKQLGDANGDPNWWNYVDAARAEKPA